MRSVLARSQGVASLPPSSFGRRSSPRRSRWRWLATSTRGRPARPARVLLLHSTTTISLLSVGVRVRVGLLLLLQQKGHLRARASCRPHPHPPRGGQCWSSLRPRHPRAGHHPSQFFTISSTPLVLLLPYVMDSRWPQSDGAGVGLAIKGQNECSRMPCLTLLFRFTLF